MTADGNGLDFHLEEGQYCGVKNCSKLLWDAVGVADQPNYWEACECSRSLCVFSRSLKTRLHRLHEPLHGPRG